MIFLIVIACSTGPQSGSLSGTVNLEGHIDHFGIVIGIYELEELDPDIIEANQKWPHIGVIINQHTEFDHRFGTLVKTGETDASGYFEISDIATGSYNVVAIKDGFGFRYIYNVQINNGDNTLPTARATLTLYSETLVNSDISSPTTWQTDHHYIIEQDIIIDDELTIEPGAVIRLNEGKEITSYGSLNAVGEYENLIWFTKNDGFSENLSTTEPDSNYIWDRVTLEPYSQAQVQWCKFDWANIALLNQVNGFEISDCVFSDSQCGFKAEDVDSTFVKNLICNKIRNSSEGGIYYQNINSGAIERSIALKSENAIKIKDGFCGEVKNNLLLKNKYGIYLLYFGGMVYNNELTENQSGADILLGGKPTQDHLTATIKYNNLCSETGIYILRVTSQYSFFSADFMMNNFFNTNYFIILTSLINEYLVANGFFDSTHNYFQQCISEFEIKEKIIDKDEYPNLANVLITPFQETEIIGSGIQNN